MGSLIYGNSSVNSIQVENGILQKKIQNASNQPNKSIHSNKNNAAEKG